MSWEILLTALLAVVSGVTIYAVQKHFDRNAKMRERHFSIYVQIVETICELANAHNRGGEGKEEALSNYATAKMKFAIVASETAMRAFIAFDKKFTSGAKVENQEFDRLLAEFMREVRTENLGSTALTNDELIIITPYGRSVRVRENS